MDYRTREQWGAEFDVTTVSIITTPVPFLFIHHNVIAPTSDPNHDMLVTERIDIARFGKPSYDWGIHPSGVVLEGMTTHLSPDTYGYNRNSLSVMFMGNFENELVTDAAMYAGRELVARINSYGWFTEMFAIRGHKDVYATKCPGANLYPRISELLVPPTPIPDDPTKEDNMLNTVVLPDGSVLVTIVGTDDAVWAVTRKIDGTWSEQWKKVGGQVRKESN